MKRFSAQDLEKGAMTHIHNYEGRQVNRGPETGRNFNGPAVATDPFAGRNFKMVIKNVGASAVDRVIALIPAYFAAASQVKSSDGSAVAAIIKEGTVISETDKDLIANGKPKSIDEFLAFLRYNPTRITGIKMKVDDSEQYSEDILLRNETPLRDLGYTTLTPSNYISSTQQNDKLVEIPLTDWQFDNQTSVVTTIKAGRTVEITFFIGVIDNAAANLNSEVQQARAAFTRQF